MRTSSWGAPKWPSGRHRPACSPSGDGPGGHPRRRGRRAAPPGVAGAFRPSPGRAGVRALRPLRALRGFGGDAGVSPLRPDGPVTRGGCFRAARGPLQSRSEDGARLGSRMRARFPSAVSSALRRAVLGPPRPLLTPLDDPLDDLRSQEVMGRTQTCKQTSISTGVRTIGQTSVCAQRISTALVTEP